MDFHNEIETNAPPGCDAHRYGDVYISDKATVHLGDNYHVHRDLFENGTHEQRKAALFNALNYAGANAKRDHVNLMEVGPGSFTWVSSTNLYAWLRTGNDPFWIVGKPGSGKSTLMRHLADSRSTLEQLKIGGIEWKIVQFFFDFRAGKDVANHPLGMVKLFLQQLMRSVTAITKFLEETDAQRRLSTGTVDDLVEVLADAIRVADINVCAFIDGLDEYEGSLWDLCSLFEVLRHRTGMKMCFASRPEPEIKQAFRKWPTLIMQDHNDISIIAYLDRKLAQHSTVYHNIERLFSQQLRDQLLKKAQGVMLWAKFVIDELLKECGMTTTTWDLIKMLDGLPEELDEIYSRILGKIPLELVSDAALLLYLISGRFATSASVIFQAIAFIQTNFQRFTFLQSNLDIDSIEFRTKALLGNLLDFVEDRGDMSVRLIHLSLVTHLDNTKWINTHLPAGVLHRYSGSLELVSNVIQRADFEGAVRMEAFENQIDRARQVVQQLPHDQYWHFRADPVNWDYLEPFGSPSCEGKWKPWSQLLVWALRSSLDLFSGISFSTNEQNSDLLTSTLTARIMQLHLRLCRKCNYVLRFPPWLVRVSNLQRANAIYLLFAIVHGMTRYLDLAISTGHYEFEILDDLLDLVIWQVYDWQWDALFDSDKLGISYFKGSLRVLAKNGCYVQGRHLCPLDVETTGHGLWKNIKYASLLRPSGPWSQSHTKDCRHRSAGASLLGHWCYERCYYESWLEFFVEAGEDPNKLLSPDFGPFHAIFELPNTSPWLGNMTRKVFALALAGASPMVKSSKGSALTYARSLRRKWKWQLFIGKFKTNEKGKVAREYIEELEMTINVFETYAEIGSWPQDFLDVAHKVAAKERKNYELPQFEILLNEDFPNDPRAQISL